MGHVVFLVLHLVGLVAFWPALLLTVPLHLIYAAVLPKAKVQEAASQGVAFVVAVGVIGLALLAGFALQG